MTDTSTHSCRACSCALGSDNWVGTTRRQKKYICSTCSKEASRARYAANKEKFAERQRQYVAKHRDRVLENKKAALKRTSTASRMIWGAKARAKTRGVPFSLTEDDIMVPERCPVLGVLLERGEGRPTDYSPSLDRLVPELGYVPGNVQVISNRANRIKADATIAELEAVTSWLRASTNPRVAL
jgi:hypothetical protein